MHSKELPKLSKTSASVPLNSNLAEHGFNFVTTTLLIRRKAKTISKFSTFILCLNKRAILSYKIKSKVLSISDYSKETEMSQGARGIYLHHQKSFHVILKGANGIIKRSSTAVIIIFTVNLTSSLGCS